MAHNRIILMMNTDEITELPEPDDRVLMYITGYIFPLLKKLEEDPDELTHEPGAWPRGGPVTRPNICLLYTSPSPRDRG